MNDLENDSGEEELELDEEQARQAEEDTPGGVEGEGEGEAEVGDEMIVPEGGIKPAQELDQDQVDQMELASVAAVSQVAKLTASRTMKDVLSVSYSHSSQVVIGQRS